jgi:hypothetical protein
MTLWPLVVRGNQLISGGATYLSGLTFDISALEYIIGSTIYTAATSQVTLNSGDTVNDRIDVIYADVSGNTGFVEGTPSTNPSKPSLDNATQVEITFVTVPAGGGAPDINITKVYDEALESGGGEWDVIQADTNILSADTVTAYSGTKSINFSAATDGELIKFSNPTPYDTTDDNTISFYVKNHTNNWANNDEIELRFFDSGGTETGFVVFKDNTFGFDGTELFNWQVISIPLGDFNMTSNLVSQITLTARASGGGGTPSVNCFVDLIRFQAGAPTTSPQNIWLSFKGDDAGIAIASSSSDQLILSGGTNIYTEVSNITKTATFKLKVDEDIVPETDNTVDAGTSVKRFRAINTVSGYSSVWSATTKVYTQTLDLGLDSSGNTRTITANNSIIQDDILRGGTY